MEDKSRMKNKGNKQKTVTNMVDINPRISRITLNVSGLNTPIKKQRLLEWRKIYVLTSPYITGKWQI